MLAALGNPDTWMALFEIAVINIVLSGDNAVVIALACRSLAPARPEKGLHRRDGRHRRADDGADVLRGAADDAALHPDHRLRAAVVDRHQAAAARRRRRRRQGERQLLGRREDDHHRRHRDEHGQRARHGGRREGPSGNAVPRTGDHDAADPVRQRDADEADGTLSVLRHRSAPDCSAMSRATWRSAIPQSRRTSTRTSIFSSTSRRSSAHCWS